MIDLFDFEKKKVKKKRTIIKKIIRPSPTRKKKINKTATALLLFIKINPSLIYFLIKQIQIISKKYKIIKGYNNKL